MMIEIDPNFFINTINYILNDFVGKSAFEVFYILMFKYWLWLLIVFVFLKYLIYPEWQMRQAGKWVSQFPRPIILAIDVPKRSEQSVQAMENMFDHLQGLHGTFNKLETYWNNAFQRSLSVELVSIEGNIQYLVRCPADWRNLVEAAVYSQFPDAEITEVEDYVNTVPHNFPNETHDMWGVEMSLAGNKYVPLKSYTKFEHRFSETFVDPMAALLENMSSIGPGEQIWIQYLLTPLAVDWGIKEGREEVNKIIGIKSKPKESFLGNILKIPADLVNEFTEQLAGVNLGSSAETKSDEKQPSIMNLTSGQRDVIDGIERKTAKWAFRTKIRYVYVFEKGKGNKVIGVNGMIGAFKQWNDVNTNGLRPMLKETSPSKPQYLFKDYRREARKNILMRAYVRRDTVVGVPGKPMCSEELASLWHFPGIDIKAPLVKMTDFTKVSAPVGLPMEPTGLKPIGQQQVPAAEQSAVGTATPEIVSEEVQEVTPNFDYDSDDFEKQFAKDKQAFEASRPARKERLAEIAQEEQETIAAKEVLPEKETEQSEKKQKDIVPEKPGNIPFID